MDLFTNSPETAKESKKNKPESEIKVDYIFIETQISNFIKRNKSNLFYDKNIVFSKELRGNKFIEFQIIGNLGGWADDEKLTIETDYFIISDKIINDIKINKNDQTLKMLDEILNIYSKAEKGRIRNYKYNGLKIISEEVFLNMVLNRCNKINDNVTKELILKLNN